METVKRPYEFLARWKDGVLVGAHVGFEVTVTENGQVLSTTPLNVVPVDVGQGQGFPLADILGQLQIDALKDREAALAAKAQAESDKATAEAAKTAAEAERDAALAAKAQAESAKAAAEAELEKVANV